MKALVFGVTGQDGSYLTDLLLSKGYEVHGLIRKSATGNTVNIEHLLSDPAIYGKSLFLHRGDLADPTSIYRVIADVRPEEIYNEADQDHVSWSYDMVGYSSDITAGAVARILEMIRQIDSTIRYIQPCTSNMFGKVDCDTQDESTPFNPQSPYAVAKTFAYYMTRYYRQAYDMHASNVILFNHESPRRPPEYVTRKITQSVARIALEKQSELVLGDTSARVDWGFSGDYVEAEWAAAQMEKADDYVIATGEAHSVQDFVDAAFSVVGLDPKNHVKTSSEFFRPTPTSTLIGDYSKAKEALGFEPKTRFKDLVRMMVEADLERERNLIP
jgi:GDPmannose 4,6-dehydratase